MMLPVRVVVASLVLGSLAPLSRAAPVTVGVNVHLPPSDTLDLADELGAEWIRIDFNWNLGEPSRDDYQWGLFDSLVDAAHARGLHVFATIGYGAAWASVSDDRNNDGPSNDVPDATEYQQFVTLAASRYSDGRVEAWGTWNEPNLGDFFEGTEQEWLDNAFGPAIAGIQAGCPSCLVVGPELASIGDVYDDYLAAALDAHGADLDVISFHIYAAFPEDDSGAGGTKDSFYNKLDEHRYIEVGGVPIYEGPLSVREVAVAQGYSAKPIWITETGEQAAVTSDTDLEAQRQYVERVVTAQESRSWWGATLFYELSEEHPDGMWPDIHWGLALRIADADDSYSDNFQRKPAFTWLADYLATTPDPPDAGPGPGDPDAAPGSPDGGGSVGPDGGGAGEGDGGSVSEVDGGTGADDGGGGGCGCRTGSSSSSGALLALLVGLLIVRRRR